MSLLSINEISEYILKIYIKKKKSKKIKKNLINFDLITKKKIEKKNFNDLILLSIFRNSYFGIKNDFNNILKSGIIFYSILKPFSSIFFSFFFFAYKNFCFYEFFQAYKKPRKSYEIFVANEKYKEFFLNCFSVLFFSFLIFSSKNFKTKKIFTKKIFEKKKKIKTNKKKSRNKKKSFTKFLILIK